MNEPGPGHRKGRPPGSMVQLRVERPQAKKPIELVALGPWRGMYGHYRDDIPRSVPCVGEGCVWHHRELLWWGFFPALSLAQGPGGFRPFVAEVTEHAAMQLAECEMRGLCLRLSRARVDNKARVEAEILPQHCLDSDLPPAFDVAAVLTRIYAPVKPRLDEKPPPFPCAPRVATLRIIEEVNFKNPVQEQEEKHILTIAELKKRIGRKA